jgi:sulfide:quinone oxidoreductase
LEITVVDRDDIHPYQLGFMFLPFGSYAPKQLTRSRHAQLDDGITFLTGDVHRVDPVERCVTLWDDRMLSYDYLVIASGTEPRPDKTPGMLGPEWRRSIFDFYTLHGTLALAKALPRLDHRRLVVHITDMPIKCPVAPLEFASLADAWLRDRGLRDRIELVFVIPLSGAFTRSVAAQHLGSMLDERKILVERDFRVERVERRTLVSYDGREVPFDLLVTVPLNMDAEYTARSGLGDELNYVPVDPHTQQSTAYPTIFALGDAANVPATKAGSVAHFEVETFVRNFLELVAGKPMTGLFDGHANCFVESGHVKGLLLDFNYDIEPLPGTFPIPAAGPRSLPRRPEPTTSASSRSGGSTGTSSCLDFPYRYPPACPCSARTARPPAHPHPQPRSDHHAHHDPRRPPDPRRRRSLPRRSPPPC